MGLRWACAVPLGAVSAAAQENAGSITGTVVDAGDAGIPNVTVRIVSSVPLETKTDASGDFAIAGVAPGTYNLQTQVMGFFAKDLDVRVEAGTETSLGRVVLEVKVPPCVGSPHRPHIAETKLPVGAKPRVSGSTRGERYGALRNMTVRLLVAGTSKVIATTVTGHNGEFQFEDLKPGVYDISVSFGEGTFLGEETFAKARNLRVRKGRELEVGLTWTQPPGQICL